MTKQEAADFIGCKINDERVTIVKKCDEKEAELHRLYPRNTRYNQLGEELEKLRLARQILLFTPVPTPKAVVPPISSQGGITSSQTITQNSAPKQTSISKIIIGFSAILTPILLIVILFMYFSNSNNTQPNQTISDAPPPVNTVQNDGDNLDNNDSLEKEELTHTEEENGLAKNDDPHDPEYYDEILNEIDDPEIRVLMKEVLDEAEEISRDAKSWKDIYLKIEDHIHTESEHKFGHPEGYTILTFAAIKAMGDNQHREMRERMRQDEDNKTQIAKLSLGHHHWEEVVQALYKKDEKELIHMLAEVYHNWHEILEGTGKLDRHHDDH